MTERVTAWLADPATDRGVHLLDDDSGEWRFLPYSEVAARVAGTVEALHEAGLAGARLAILADDADDFIVKFLATSVVGGTCVPIVPLLPLQSPDDYRARIERLLAMAQPRTVLTDTDLPELFPAYPATVVPSSLRGERLTPVGVDPSATAIVQFSSGSSGTPKGVRISRRALDANVGAIASWLGMGAADRTASWLPLYHDMGLIGTLLTPLATQTDLFLLTPMQFLRSPATWLRCFGELGCTLTAAPAFGYGYAARRVDPATLDGCDFGDWRVAIVGAEPVRADVIDGFAARFAERGFRRDAFCPAYGLAEATLVVTGTAPDDPPRTLAGGATVVVGDDGSPADRPGLRAGELMGSGRALPGFEVVVRTLDGDPAPAGSIGEIWVRGPSLADGYEPGAPGGFHDGWFRTGDVGLLDDGELHVLGRVSDSFKVRGERVLAEQAEQAIQLAVPQARSLVVVPSRRHGAGLTVVVETGSPWDDAAVAEAREAVSAMFDGAHVDLLFVGRGGVPRTTSGKPQRAECWRRYVLGTEMEPVG